MKQRSVTTLTAMAGAAKKVATRPRLKKAADALTAYLRNPSAYKQPPRLQTMGLFTEEDIRAIHMVAAKQADQPFSERHFVEEMEKSTPVCAKPRITNKALDLWRVLAQPEFIDRLWPQWKSRTGTRGQDPGFFVKAILLMTASLGLSAHFDDNYDELTKGENNRWQALFEWLEQTSAMVTQRKPQPLGMKTYEKMCEQINLVTDPAINSGALTIDHCVEINSLLCRFLRLIYPDFGKRLGIDGMLVKAWVNQSYPKTPHKRAPKATMRTIEGRNGSVTRKVVGYYLVVLSDLATGVPVAWRLLEAGTHHGEPEGSGYLDHNALMTLLADVFEEDEDFPVEFIVADRAWNSADCVRDCAVRYGIHLLSGLDRSTETRKVRKVSKHDSDTIGGYDGYGNVYCRRHGTVMKRSGSDFLGREGRKKLGLKPGEEAPQIDSKFRLRFSCEIGGGPCDHRPSLPMSLDWNGFSRYPHTIDAGWEDKQAFRLAMYARRNTCEGIFGALKVGHKLGLDGADRTHTANEATLETLLSLGLLMRTATVTANERILRGELADTPPPDLAAKIS